MMGCSGVNELDDFQKEEQKKRVYQKEEEKKNNLNIRRNSHKKHLPIDASNKPSDHHIIIDANYNRTDYPDLESSKINEPQVNISQSKYKLKNPQQDSNTNNLLNNINKPVPTELSKNMDQAPILNNPQNNREEISFECKFSETDLNNKIDEFIKSTREQNEFYIKQSDDNIYNQLRKSEEKTLKEKFIFFKTKFLSQVEQKYKQEFSKQRIVFKSISEKIISHENGEFILTNKIRKNILEIEQNTDNFSVKHITILLVGKSGVGKSTLCNNLLRLPEDKKALTDIGKPVTQKSTIYSNPPVNFLKVIDTAGIEIIGENKIENVITNCKETIEGQVNSADKNDMVSCIFYCFTGSRIEDEEVQFLDKLRKSLEGNTIPILYVYTQAVRQSAINGMKECIEKERIRLGEVEFVPILSEDYDLIDNKYLKSYGLDIILEKAVKTIKNNIKSNLFEIRTKEISDEIINDFKKKNKKIRNFSIEQMYLDFIKNLNKTLNKEDLMNFLFQILEKCFIFFLQPNEIKNLNKNSFEEYKKNFKDYIEKCYDLFNETSTNIIESFKVEMAAVFLDEQARIEQLGINIQPKNIRVLNQFIKIIDDYCRSNFMYIAQKEFIKHFISDIFEKICEKNEENCNNKIISLINEEKSIKDAVNKCFITKYKNIEKKIDEYKVGLKKNVYGRNYV